LKGKAKVKRVSRKFARTGEHMAIVSPAPVRAVALSRVVRGVDVDAVSTRHEADAPSTTPHQIVPPFPIPAADSSSEPSRELPSPSVSNRMSVGEIARPDNVVGD
jgi:hypothetical protein